MNPDYDAIIIGAGIIGAATAFELGKLGYCTLNVDRLPAAGYGSTSNSRRFGPPRLKDDEAFGAATGGELDGAVFWPTAGYISDPQLAMRNVQRAAESRGARFLFGHSVVKVLDRDGRIAGVGLDDGRELAAPVVINVAGPHSAKVNQMAGALGDMTITTRALKQEVVHLPAPAGFDFESLGMVVSDGDIGCYCRPETGNHILIGSEDPPCDRREFVDPDDWDASFSVQGETQAMRYAQRVPGVGIPTRLQGAVDLYDASDDWIPIYDRSQVPGYYMAIGTSGNQFENAPVAGRLMAHLVQYCESGNDHDARPLAFELPRVGCKVNSGFYSRRRSVNAESSFSVLG